MIRRLFRRSQDVSGALRQLTATATPVHASAVNPDPTGHAQRPNAEIPRAAAALPCHGCAHSAAGDPYPGMPSGERPCGFCVRNPSLPDGGVADWFGDHGPCWYDGKTPFQTPMDCYIATDRLQQQRIFDELHRLEDSGQEAPGRERYDRHPLTGDPVEVWCCDGGPAPGGHTWTCWRWLGVSFG